MKTCEHNTGLTCTTETCCERTSIKIEPPEHDRVTHVYMICVAYEAGVGKGIDARDTDNPYPTGGDPINRQCHEAWQHGYDRGEYIRLQRKEGVVTGVKL